MIQKFMLQSAGHNIWHHCCSIHLLRWLPAYYFDLASRKREMNLDQMAQFSNRMFGTSLSENDESDEEDNEEIIEPVKVEEIDPEQVDKNKDK